MHLWLKSAVVFMFIYCASGQNDPACETKNKKFVIHMEKLNWFGALLNCSLQGMSLATINSQQEQDTVVDLIKPLYPEDNIWRTLWLGGSDLRKYQEWFWFSTGEDMKYSNFKVGEPNDLAGEERCLEMVANIEWNYEWNDQSCSDTMGFICEYFV